MKKILIIFTIILTQFSFCGNKNTDLYSYIENLRTFEPEKLKCHGTGFYHGEDSRVENWLYFSKKKKSELLKLFNLLNSKKIELTRIDHKSNPNLRKLDRYEIWIGPIRNCKDYYLVTKLLQNSSFNFQSFYWCVESETKTKLDNCLDIKDFP